MPQPNDLSRSLVALDQDSTIIAVVEMSQSSWLVAGVLPGVERQPRMKLEPSAERLLGLLHRWRDEAVTNEFAEARWGFPPGRPKGAPVINFRSEGRRFPVGRCLVPASFFYEFTGTKSPKSKWRVTNAGEDGFCFASQALARPAMRRRGRR